MVETLSNQEALDDSFNEIDNELSGLREKVLNDNLRDENGKGEKIKINVKLTPRQFDKLNIDLKFKYLYDKIPTVISKKVPGGSFYSLLEPGLGFKKTIWFNLNEKDSRGNTGYGLFMDDGKYYLKSLKYKSSFAWEGENEQLSGNRLSSLLNSWYELYLKGK